MIPETGFLFLGSISLVAYCIYLKMKQYKIIRFGTIANALMLNFNQAENAFISGSGIPAATPNL